MRKLIALCTLTISPILYADIPLTVESLISDKGKFIAEFGIAYGNNKTSNTKIGGYFPVQISDTSFVNIPINIQNERIQNEYLITTFGLKYGVSKDFDINLRTNLLYTSNQSLEVSSDQKSKNDIDISDITVGVNYLFVQDDVYPALVGFLETNIFEKNLDTKSNFSSWSLGITTYRSYDPIVLSLTAGYKYSLERKINSIDNYKPADLFFFTPQIAFAANDRISLVGGFNFKATSNQKLNSKIFEKKRNSLDYNFGVGYGLTDKSNLNVIATLRQDFDNSNEIRLIFNQKF